MILNNASIGSLILSIWRELDSTEVLYTWPAMMERTVETWNREMQYPLEFRILYAMKIYREIERDGRLN